MKKKLNYTSALSVNLRTKNDGNEQNREVQHRALYRVFHQTPARMFPAKTANLTEKKIDAVFLAAKVGIE